MDTIARYFAAGSVRVEIPGLRRATAATSVTPRVDDSVPAGGFRMRYCADEIVVDHADDRGLSAALEAIEYLNDDLSFDTALEVRDAPVLATRAYLMDMSGDRIPAWDGFVRIVEILERLRFNQLELRVGHAFTYHDQEVAWEGSSPLTPTQLRRIEALCRSHGIALVLAIEPLTHWERWLALPEYAGRAELPGGRVAADGSGRHVPPSELAATPPNAHFVADLVDQLTSTLSSRRINIGGHAARELGLGRSRALVERHGRTAVYWEFLQHATEALERHDSVGEMWADLLAADPGLLAELAPHITPIVRCADVGGFPEAGAALVGAGRPFWVAPGTSTWNSLSGRRHQAAANIDEAVRWGTSNGATGLLLTSWAGQGHWGPEVLNIPSMVQAAVQAWRGADPGDQMPLLCSALVTEDVATAMLRLGDIPGAAPIPVRNSDVTWEALRLGGHLPAEWSIDGARVDAWRDVLADVRRVLAGSVAGAGSVARSQVSWCADMCDFGALLVEMAAARRTGGRVPASETDLRDQWDTLVSRQRALWLQTSREGGLAHSLSLLRPVDALVNGGSAAAHTGSAWPREAD